jgi:glycosyltransferase involved in cell wall biosynthesis
VVDDGSTDGSSDIANSLGASVRVLVEPHRGVSFARNSGISNSHGEWIVFLDADDILLPGTLRRRIDVAAPNACDVVICNWKDLIDFEDQELEGATRSVDFVAISSDAEIAFATDAWVPSAALMFNRRLVERIGGFREDLAIIQDARFLFDAAHRKARFTHAGHVGAYYRVRPNSLSRRDPAAFWREVLLNGHQIERLWRTQGKLSAEQKNALAKIYNGASIGLFHVGDSMFQDAVRALRRTDLMNWRNRLIEMATRVLGQRAAMQLIRILTKLRRAICKDYVISRRWMPTRGPN